MSSYLTGMNVLVTGASDGIGAAIAQQLAKQGVESLILAGRDRSRLEKTARSVEVPCQLHVADLSVQTGVDQLLDDALEESYRSVLETDQSSHSSMSNPSSMVTSGNDRRKQNGDSSLV